MQNYHVTQHCLPCTPKGKHHLGKPLIFLCQVHHYSQQSNHTNDTEFFNTWINKCILQHVKRLDTCRYKSHSFCPASYIMLERKNISWYYLACNLRKFQFRKKKCEIILRRGFMPILRIFYVYKVNKLYVFDNKDLGA